MESLRLYPQAVQLMGCNPTKPINLSILKGFIPERFMNPEKEVKNNWVPFSDKILLPSSLMLHPKNLELIFSKLN
ncbi:22000_t:CDS:2 [Cetraspora pellucida]|uniref:22000_t:CDS:1 n=1 Tax=Cetraspora pellucida TaxID=1433469 RepID=A0A9N9G019_9GLOM|nr:22000_t:CDS:2 [Cetraspora pellucida]